MPHKYAETRNNGVPDNAHYLLALSPEDIAIPSLLQNFLNNKHIPRKDEMSRGKERFAPTLHATFSGANKATNDPDGSQLWSVSIGVPSWKPDTEYWRP
jgi:hypothetical protein